MSGQNTTPKRILRANEERDSVSQEKSEDGGAVLIMFSKTDTSKGFCLSALHRLVHTVPEEFINGLFSMKTRDVFRPQCAGPAEEFQNATITGHFGNPERKIRRPSSLRSFVFKMFYVHTEAKIRRYQIPPV